MSELKDPAIKLFGKTIQLPDIPVVTAAVATPATCTEDPPCLIEEEEEEEIINGVDEDHESDKDIFDKRLSEEEDERAHSMMSKELTMCSVVNDYPKTPSVDTESEAAKKSKTEEDQSETSDSQEKTLKKPDKILPCPRCKSMDTKFCYYNNYNVSQPRHFCKNCQRYWTAGGTMRNVPVGAGRRKNKSSAFSHCHQITASETATHNVRNGNVLTFGSDALRSESMASSVLNVAEKRENGFQKTEELRNGDEHSSGSSVADIMQNCHGFSPQVPYFPGAPWPYPWNPQMGPPFFPSAFALPFYPYWGCTVPPGPWNVPWVTPPCTNVGPISEPNNTQTLGKHSREEEEPQKENKVWIPKTLRIDDPGEAAQSSIWATLGIKKDGSDSVNRGSLFKAFESKVGEKNHVFAPSSVVMQANPAALSRSRNFHETS